jgi:cytochrome c-type biogenesis protein CcmH
MSISTRDWSIGLLMCLGLLVSLSGTARAISDPAEMLPNRNQEERAEAVGRQLRCLVCQNESIEDSNADLAKDLRQLVRQRIAAGDTDQQATAWVVARYGDFVRLRPPMNAVTALLWGSPFLAVGAGLTAVILARRRRVSAPPPLSDAEQTRLAELTGQ